MPVNVARNKERVREFFEAIEDHEDGRIEDLEEFVSDDVVNHNPVTSEGVEIERVEGRAEFEEHLQSLTAAFPDLRIGIEDMIADDDRVAVRSVL